MHIIKMLLCKNNIFARARLLVLTW